MFGLVASTFEWTALTIALIGALFSIITPEIGKAKSWMINAPLSLLFLLPVISAKYIIDGKKAAMNDGAILLKH